MIFDYNQTNSFANSIVVNDPGNCALYCTNQDFNEYYLCTQTEMGKTYILKFGPIIGLDSREIDIITEKNPFILTYKKINYKESTISHEINLFINDKLKGINQVKEIDLETILKLVPKADLFKIKD